MQTDLSNSLHHLFDLLPNGALVVVIIGLPRRDIPWLGLDLLQNAPAQSAPRLGRVDALRVPPVLLPTVHAAPDVLVIDLVAVPGRDLDPAAVDGVVLERPGALGRPLLEAGTVRVVADVGDHIVGEVAVLVGERVQEAVFGVDDPLRQLDRGVVFDLHRRRRLVAAAA